MPPRSTREWLEEKYGVPLTTDDNQVVSSLGTAAVQVMRQRPQRVGFLVVNISLNNIFLRPRQAATTSAGIRIDANGGALSMWLEEDGEVVGWEWFGIADGAASPIMVLETIIAPV